MNANQPANQSAAAYAALAHIYDLQHATYTPDVDMYLQFAEQSRATRAPDAAILEIGCGTGRVMIPLVQAGYRVVGIDESPQMLNIARAHLAVTPAGNWQLIETDARGLNLPEQFGMAMIALNTFLHNLTRADQLHRKRRRQWRAAERLPISARAE